MPMISSLLSVSLEVELQHPGLCQGIVTISTAPIAMTLYDFTMFSGFRLCAADQCDKLQLWDMYSNYIHLRNQSRSVMFSVQACAYKNKAKTQC